ncbi:MAG TPA: SMC-Scp complex subunit ScpB [Oscillospiraceae bacterium]|nr:SMC-Scp complex subunit ScpB [Oscillospiraceae bacterium]
MKAKKLISAAEAILFAAAEPLEADRIADVLEISVEDTKKILENLSAKLDEMQSGICLLRLDEKYQLCSRKEFVNEVRAALDLKRNTPLSQAAFEVLAIIAYNQPITKSYIDQIRGVECSGVIATLNQKGLIEEKGRLELPGRPILYGTTASFLRCFSLSSLDELPELPKDDKEVLMSDTDEKLNQISINLEENI